MHACKCTHPYFPRRCMIYTNPVSTICFSLVVIAMVMKKGTSSFVTMAPASAIIPRSVFRHTISSLRKSRLSRSSISSSSFESNAEIPLADRLNGLDSPTVWQEFSPLAAEHGAINLGQGFPDWDPPAFCVEAMRRSIDPAFGRNANQYARSYAHMPLAKVLAEDYTERWQKEATTPACLSNFEINPATQIATAVGCTNALFCALQGLLNPGDEVLLFEPAFDIYMAQVRMAGGAPVYCPLRPREDKLQETASEVFSLDLDELETKIGPRTKVLLLNTPHNPTGKIFSETELRGIAKLLIDKHPHVTVIADEVYEHIVFGDTDDDADHDSSTTPNTSTQQRHISMATIPGMFDRTLTLSSSGKTFSATGWKVGWAVGPAHLVKAVTAVQQWVNFSAPTPNQDAIAQCLQLAKEGPYEGYTNYYHFLAAEYKRKRNILAEALTLAGMTPVMPPGGFFIMADTSNIHFPDHYRKEITDAMPTPEMPRDWALSRWLTREVGVTAIPPSAFYSLPNVHLAQNMLRFAFCKGDDTILEAKQRLESHLNLNK